MSYALWFFSVRAQVFRQMFFGHQSGIFAETGVASPHHTVGFKAGPFYVQANSIDFFFLLFGQPT